MPTWRHREVLAKSARGFPGRGGPACGGCCSRDLPARGGLLQGPLKGLWGGAEACTGQCVSLFPIRNGRRGCPQHVGENPTSRGERDASNICGRTQHPGEKGLSPTSGGGPNIQGRRGCPRHPGGESAVPNIWGAPTSGGATHSHLKASGTRFLPSTSCLEVHPVPQPSKISMWMCRFPCPPGSPEGQSKMPAHWKTWETDVPLCPYHVDRWEKCVACYPGPRSPWAMCFLHRTPHSGREAGCYFPLPI